MKCLVEVVVLFLSLSKESKESDIFYEPKGRGNNYAYITDCEEEATTDESSLSLFFPPQREYRGHNIPTNNYKHDSSAAEVVCFPTTPGMFAF